MDKIFGQRLRATQRTLTLHDAYDLEPMTARADLRYAPQR
jgi:hypothetical protein